MATSNSVNFNLTRNEIINTAFSLLGVYGTGRTVSSEDMQLAVNVLNMMIKAWQGQGIHIWATELAYLFPEKFVNKYTIGNTAATGSGAALVSDSVLTKLNGAHAASATTLVVDSTAGMLANDQIGIVTTDKATHWTTIVSVDSATGLTITDGLNLAASNNAQVYTYTTQIAKPMQIVSMRSVTGIDQGSTSDQSFVIMNEYSEEEMREYGGRTSSGRPMAYYYNPDLTTGFVEFSPKPNDSRIYFEFTFRRSLEDMDSPGDNFDFPVEWQEAITYHLATRLAPHFGKDAKLQSIAPLAEAFLTARLAGDQEFTSVYIRPQR